MRESIVLATYYGSGAHQHYESLRKIPQLNLASIGNCPIDMARSVILERALRETPCSVLVFVDADIEFTPEGYEQIVASCLETKAVVAGCYITKRLNGSQVLAGTLVDKDQEIGFFGLGALHRARTVPLGFTAIHREAIEQIIQRGQAGERCTFLQGLPQQIEAYPLFMPMVHGGMYQPEDCAFSRRALAAGVDLFFDTRVRLWHHGSHGYRITDLHLRSEDYESAEIAFKRSAATPETQP